MNFKEKHLEISVIMCVFSEPEIWLRESIESILNQTYINFEFIIINDNPSRELNKEILEEYQSKDQRILIVENEENLGLTKSLNIGLKLAHGKYIARMDGDDIANLNRFKYQLEYLQKHLEISILGSWTKTFGIENIKYKYPTNPKIIKASLFFGNRISHSSVMFRMDDLLKNKFYYDLFFLKSQDYDLWSRASLKLKLENLDKFLMYNRTHHQQISNKGLNDQNKFANKINLRWLNFFDIELNEIKQNIYIKFLNKDNLTNEEFTFIINLLKIIIHKNKKLLLFDKFYFKLIIFKRLISYFTAINLKMRLKFNMMLILLT